MKQLLFSFFFISSLLFGAPDKQARSTNGNEEKLLYPSLVNRFYLLSGNKPFWMKTGTEADLLRRQLLQCIDSAYYWGEIERKYHDAALRSYAGNLLMDSAALIAADRVYIDAAIARIG